VRTAGNRRRFERARSCDCCDGSDESAPCPDTCAADAADAAVAEALARETRDAGEVKRRAYVADYAARVASVEEELRDSNARVAELEPTMHDLRGRVAEWEALELQAQKLADDAADVDAASALDAALNGAAAWELSAVSLELAAAASEIEALLDAVMQTAGLESSVTNKIDDVDVLSLGLEAVEAWDAAVGGGDAAKAELRLRALGDALFLKDVGATGARAVAVEAARAARGNALARSKLEGVAVFDWGVSSERTVRSRALAILSQQRLAADSAEGAAAALITLPEGDAARAALKTAAADLEAARSAIRLRALATDLPGPADGAFESLRGKCYEARIAKYNWEICPWGSAKQDQTRLGDFKGWGDDFASWHFKHGQYCSGHGSRELVVDLVCAADERIVDVEETDICKYRATFATPAAC